MTKPSPTSPSTTAEVLLAWDRRRKLKRIAWCEAKCDEILRQPPTDPRRPYVAQMQHLLATARGHLERGYPAYPELVQIEALAGRMNTLLLGPQAAHAHSLRGGRKPGAVDKLGVVLTEIVDNLPPRSRSLSRFARVVSELRKRAFEKTDGVIDEYRDDNLRPGCRTEDDEPLCAPGFHVHWTDADGRSQTTGEEALRKRLTALAKSRRTR